MSTSLFRRLAAVYDTSAAATVHEDPTKWPQGDGNFGQLMADVRTIVPHVTDGWLARSRRQEFIDRYTKPGYQKRGIGPEVFISGDGTVFQIINLRLKTWHAAFINSWSCGVETARLPRQASNHDFFIDDWTRPSSDPAANILGADFYVCGKGGEVQAAWWITSTYDGPGCVPAVDRQLLITEPQYRSWARLARYLAEELRVPRNFPLLPYVRRSEVLGNDADDVSHVQRFRRIVLADPAFEVLVRNFVPFGMTATDFDLINLQALATKYEAAVDTPAEHKTHNVAWKALFNGFRGFHGHGFSGAIKATHSDHADCPGDLFDWHRLARQVWDWWWHPFDFEGSVTNAPIRQYRKARRETPLIEYYFDEGDARHVARRRTWFPGAPTTPDTFQLEPGSPIYAPSNGRLIAARLSGDGSSPSLAFVLIRNEVYHRTNDALAQMAPSLGMKPFEAEGIDYALEPSYVYTLVMHLDRSAGFNFDQVSDDNPDWLNRVVVRLKECKLGLKFFDDGSNISDALWNSRPPGQGLPRPTTREGWQFDRDHNLGRFVGDLRAGRLALGPHVSDGFATPIDVHLGDFLGRAGILTKSASETVHGIRVEVFSTDLLSNAFAPLASSAWPAPEPDVSLPLAVNYRSEWSVEPLPIVARLLESVGIDASLFNWWPDVFAHLLSDVLLPPEAKLPANGVVWHYRLHDFMRWVNRTNWRSEWLKYKVTVGDVRMPPPDVPRSRRVP